MKKIILVMLTLLLAACSAGAASEFDQNIQKWDSSKPAHYRYSLFIGCFCVFTSDMPLTIEVRDGQVISITRADGSTVTADDPSYDMYMPYSTMDKVFSELKINLEGGADEVTVKYDPVLGFPTEIHFDFIKNAIDDELSLQISNLHALE